MAYLRDVHVPPNTGGFSPSSRLELVYETTPFEKLHRSTPAWVGRLVLGSSFGVGLVTFEDLKRIQKALL